MNLASPSEVRRLLGEMELHPRRSLGQNFLIDRNILDLILDALAPSPADAILEIGPGLGVVTVEIAARAGRVVAVEKDAALAAHLQRLLAGSSGVEIICADMLRVDAGGLLSSGITKVVSNLPYASGNRILVELARAPEPAQSLVLMVQREVADRLLAAAGDPEFGLLTVWTRLLYDARRVRNVSPTCFWPRPDVTSTIVAFTLRAGAAPAGEDRALFYQLTKHAFSHRRKQVASILPRAPGALRRDAEAVRGALDQVGAGARARPGDLTVQEWCDLVKVLTPTSRQS